MEAHEFIENIKIDNIENFSNSKIDDIFNNHSLLLLLLLLIYIFWYFHNRS